MNKKGTITTWNDDRGFGFITPRSGGDQVFVHIKAFNTPGRRPVLNDSVSYRVSTDGQGRLRATGVIIAGARKKLKTHRTGRVSSLLVAAGFLAMVYFAVSFAALPKLVLQVYLAASLISMLLYALDKSAAKRGAWRTKEGTLHLLSLAGGWPGAMVARSWLRHKSKKKPFRNMFWFTVVLNCGVFVSLFTNAGLEFWRNMLAAIVQAVA